MYVVTRRWHRNTVMTIINGTTRPATLEVNRYAELFTDGNYIATDVITGKQYDLSSNVPLEPRATLVLEF